MPRRYELSDFEWSIIQPLLAEQAARRSAGRRPEGAERHLLAATDRLAWADIPERYGPATTCSNRFVRWRKIGVWDRVFEAVSRLTTATCR